MSLGLGDEVAPVGRHLFGKRIGVSGVDQLILKQDASGGGIAQRMLCADEAILKGHLKNRRAGRGCALGTRLPGVQGHPQRSWALADSAT